MGKHKPIVIKFGFNRWRKTKSGIKKPQEPIKRSKYAELLFKEGAGWRE